jgi:hypothetical protein
MQNFHFRADGGEIGTGGWPGGSGGVHEESMGTGEDAPSEDLGDARFVEFTNEGLEDVALVPVEGGGIFVKAAGDQQRAGGPAGMDESSCLGHGSGPRIAAAGFRCGDLVQSQRECEGIEKDRVVDLEQMQGGPPSAVGKRRRTGMFGHVDLFALEKVPVRRAMMQARAVERKKMPKLRKRDPLRPWASCSSSDFWTS